MGNPGKKTRDNSNIRLVRCQCKYMENLKKKMFLMASIKHIPHSTNFACKRSNSRLGIYINNKDTT